MARVVLTAYGTRGDVAPFLALGRALRERGDDVVVAVDPSHAAAVAAAGLVAEPLRPSQASVLADQAPGLDRASARRLAQALIERHVLPGLTATAERLRSLAAGAALVVASPLQLAAPIAAEAAGVPWMTLTTTPLSVPSRELDTVADRDATLSARAGAAGDGPRCAWGLPAGADVLAAGALSPHAVAVCVSPSFFPRPHDWPATVEL